MCTSSGNLKRAGFRPRFPSHPAKPGMIRGNGTRNQGLRGVTPRLLPEGLSLRVVVRGAPSLAAASGRARRPLYPCWHHGWHLSLSGGREPEGQCGRPRASSWSVAHSQAGRLRLSGQLTTLDTGSVPHSGGLVGGELATRKIPIAPPGRAGTPVSFRAHFTVSLPTG